VHLQNIFETFRGTVHRGLQKKLAKAFVYEFFTHGHELFQFLHLDYNISFLKSCSELPIDVTNLVNH